MFTTTTLKPSSRHITDQQLPLRSPNPNRNPSNRSMRPHSLKRFLDPYRLDNSHFMEHRGTTDGDVVVMDDDMIEDSLKTGPRRNMRFRDVNRGCW